VREVGHQRDQAILVLGHVTDCDIAVETQDASDTTRDVVMIHVVGVSSAADGAAATL